MTSATIAVVLEHLIAEAHWRSLPQYDVFGFLSRRSSIVSFNWDGLARARCPQRPVFHPHGYLGPRYLAALTLDDLLEYAQTDESSESRSWIIPGLVMPGEEDGSKHAEMRERVFRLWREASEAVVIGDRFGLGTALDYDRVWLDTFVEAFGVNANAPIHVLDPDAERIRGELAERIKRVINLHSWPVNWYALSRVLLAAARLHDIARIQELRVHPGTLERVYATVAESSLAPA